MLRIALTHDIDRVDKTYQRFTHALRNLLKANFKKSFYHLLSNKINAYWGFDEIINIENYYNVKSTHFFLNESIEFDLFNLPSYKLSLGRYSIYEDRIKDIIRYLDKNGWEVGLHGSYRSFMNKNLMLHEKCELEKIVGHKIIGIRQHYLNLNNETWKIQKEIGLNYDTSFGSNKVIGFKNDQYKPFRPFNDNFVVFPQVIMDSLFVSNRNRSEELKKTFDLAQEHDAIIVVNWHNNYFDEKEFPNYKKYYIQLIEESLNNNATFKTLEDFYKTI